jgi:hypothetical protein
LEASIYGKIERQRDVMTLGKVMAETKTETGNGNGTILYSGLIKLRK